MNTYAIDQLQPGTITTRNGFCRVVSSQWVEVLEMPAERASHALQVADVKWPEFKGRHRARLIQTVLRPAPLCSDDRAFIHQLTTQTI